MIPLPARLGSHIRNLLLMLLGVAVFGSLGTWQLNRSAERRAELDAFAEAGRSMPVAGVPAAAPGDGYGKVILTGRYASDRQVLLDNMTREGLRGYHVLTPLYTDDGVALVNRGFVAAGADRSQLPDIAVSESRREVTGLTAPYFRRGLQLEEPMKGDSWPLRITYPTAGQLRDRVDGRLPDYQVLLADSDPDGFVRAWAPYGLSPERHIAYAVQWYGLGGAAIGIWLAVTLKRRRKRNAS